MSKYSKEEQAANRGKWTAALRSGEYQQARHQLRREIESLADDTVAIGFCCLGVACEVAVKEGVVRREQSFYGSVSGIHEYCVRAVSGDIHSDSSSTALPQAVVDWLGLSGRDGDLTERVEYKHPGHECDEEHTTGTLIGLNDDAGYTFEQIADLVDGGKVKVA